MTATVLMISPGYPAEMPFFTRGLARAGAQVIGAGDQPISGAAGDGPRPPRRVLADTRRSRTRTRSCHEVVQRAAGIHIDHVASLWEPTMVLAARIREALGIPGMTVEQTIPFRDKERMKQVLDAAGIRTPHHYRCTTATEVREAAERIGYPIIVKPIAGAGSADTYRVDSAAALDARAPETRVGGRGERRGVRRSLRVHVRHHLRRRRGALRQHRLVPAATADRATAGVDQPGDHGDARHRRTRALERSRDGPRRVAGAGIPRWVHAHGVVPARQRRGGVRRDRRAPRGRSHRRRHEFRERHRPVPAVGRSAHPRTPLRADRAPLQRGVDLQARARARAASRISKDCRACSPITASGCARSTSCRSALRGGTG